MLSVNVYCAVNKRTLLYISVNLLKALLQVIKVPFPLSVLLVKLLLVLCIIFLEGKACCVLFIILPTCFEMRSQRTII